MKNQLNSVDCAKFIDSKVPVTWEMIDPIDDINGDDELLILVIFRIKSYLKEKIN